MNAKMKKFSFKELNTRNSSGRNIEERLVDCQVLKDDKNASNFRWRVSLSQKCQKLSGIMHGDFLTFEYDDGVVLLVKSSTGEGRKLSSPGKTSGSKRVYCRFGMPKEYIGFFQDKNASKIEIKGGAICFELKYEKDI